MAKHRVERIADTGDIAFYIDNSLQLDTRDEFVYHESLFFPPAALASARNSADIDGLILGGGDGFGLREGLKSPRLHRIDLVDHDPEVIRFAKDELRSFNRSSLYDPRACVHVEEASRFLNARSALYDYIVADFTFPEDLSGCSLFTLGFLHDLSRRLKPNGIVALNTFSPERSPEAYWSVYRTLTRLKLHPKPYQVRIPSFSAHGYGKWGFFLASTAPILHREVQDILFPEDRRFMAGDVLLKAMLFESSPVFHGLNFSRILRQPEDLRALLNMSGIFASLGGADIDFSGDILPAGLWKYFSGHPEYIFFSMSAYWKERVFNILDGLDWNRFMAEAEKSLANYSRETAGQVRAMLRRVSRQWKDGDFGAESFQRAFLALIAVIIVMNMLCPDNAFAKGYYGGSHGGSSGGEGTEISLLAPAAATAFYNSYWLSSRYVPDMAGKPHNKMSFPAAASFEADQKPEQAFFALNDTTYLTKEGDVFQLIAQTHFFYRVETDRLVLYRSGQPAPVIELALDNGSAVALGKDIEVNRKALAASIRQFEQWLGWSGPAGAMVKEIAEEKKELDELIALQKVLDRLHQNNYSGSSAWSSDVPAKSMAPSIFLATDGSLVVKTADGAWKSYVFRSFTNVAGREVIPSDSALDAFFEELLSAGVKTLKAQDPMRAFIMEKMDWR